MVGVKEFFVNACVLVSIAYVSSFFHKKILINLDERVKQIIFIVISILAGWCSMFFGIHLNHSVIFDLRIVPVIISIVFCSNSLYIFFITLGIGVVRFYFGIDGAAWGAFINLSILSVVGVFLFYILRNYGFIKKTIVTVITINVFNVINIATWGVIPAFEYLYKIVPIALPASIIFSTLLVWIISDLQNEFLNKIDLQNKANKDPLTQLYNKRAFQYFYHQIISKANKTHLPISAAFIDIDHFKQINDTYGHLTADIILQKVSQRINNIIRDTDIAARYGGDEFVIIMPNCTKDIAISRMEELCSQFNVEPIVARELELFITLSIGVTASPSVDIKKLLETADKSLYLAKKDGRNRVASFS